MVPDFPIAKPRVALCIETPLSLSVVAEPELASAAQLLPSYLRMVPEAPTAKPRVALCIETPQSVLVVAELASTAQLLPSYLMVAELASAAQLLPSYLRMVPEA